jgi:hypothetical protein
MERFMPEFITTTNILTDYQRVINDLKYSSCKILSMDDSNMVSLAQHYYSFPISINAKNYESISELFMDFIKSIFCLSGNPFIKNTMTISMDKVLPTSLFYEKKSITMPIIDIINKYYKLIKSYKSTPLNKLKMVNYIHRLKTKEGILVDNAILSSSVITRYSNAKPIFFNTNEGIRFEMVNIRNYKQISKICVPEVLELVKMKKQKCSNVQTNKHSDNIYNILDKSNGLILCLNCASKGKLRMDNIALCENIISKKSVSYDLISNLFRNIEVYDGYSKIETEKNVIYLFNTKLQLWYNFWDDNMYGNIRLNDQYFDAIYRFLMLNKIQINNDKSIILVPHL